MLFFLDKGLSFDLFTNSFYKVERYPVLFAFGDVGEVAGHMSHAYSTGQSSNKCLFSLPMKKGT